MIWQPIVVGVDGSHESARAATLAARMAAAAGTTCHLVHATRDVWAAVPSQDVNQELRRILIDSVTEEIGSALRPVLDPPDLADRVTVRLGRPPVVLKRGWPISTPSWSCSAASIIRCWVVGSAATPVSTSPARPTSRCS